MPSLLTENPCPERDGGPGKQSCFPHETRSDQRRTGDAWAPGAEEGRGTLRKGSGSRVRAVSRPYPNGETQSGLYQITPQGEGTGRTETSQYSEEKKRFRE